MNVAVMKTKAEQGFVEQFEKAAGRLPGDDAIAAARHKAIGRFGALGLPHRRVEEWKYTDLRAALKEAFAPADRKGDDPVDLDAALGQALASIDGVRIAFIDGRFAPSLSRFDGARGTDYVFDDAAAGFAASGSEWSWLKAGMADDAGPKGDAMFSLNTAFAADGALLRIADGAKLAAPIHIVFVSRSGSPASEFTRSFIQVGAGAEATLLESHVALGSTARQTNSAIEISVGERARLDHVKSVRGAGAVHVGSAVVSVGADAIYRGYQFTSDVAIARNQCFITFAGEGAKLDFSGVFLARGLSHIDTTLVVDHAVPRCESRELFKGVLDGAARGVFQGKIIVRPDAQKTDGKQMAQALMLSPDAEFDSKPELEIYADDVVCGHGTTSAELDADLLFYCKSRGIPEAQARALLIESFIGESIDRIADDAVRAAVADLANNWLSSGQI